MTTEETLFADALAMTSAPERRAFLDEACGGDAELRARVEVLLAAHERAGTFLESPPIDVPTMPGDTAAKSVAGATVAPAAAPVERSGATVGRYKLLERVGEGGMGVVFMAEQVYPVRRRVALKIIKPGMDTKQVIARFGAERQALAMMDHPNIAKVLDAGATDAGRPYFVMELVRGVPITDYCDQQTLAPRQRLELFVQVCRAVQHAHQKGIIHRDLKPSNILVTLADDGRPVPKIIDFGIAKATAGQPLTEQTLFTELRQLVGTPLYMSPEQAERSAMQDVDTRSDVYSLGVLLYELLTGTTPFDKQRLGKAACDEVRRIIREEEPPKPSTRLSTMGDGLATVSASRATDPKKLSQTVSGELDWIVMRAMEKDRTRRYETANGLGRDIERYLADEPVEACPPSKTYRVRKLARRYRRTLLVAAAFGLLLLSATAISTREAVRATKAEAEAARERDQAVREKARADEEAALSDRIGRFFLWEVIGQASPERSARLGLQYDPKLTIRAALDRAAGRIGELAKDKPILAARVSDQVGLLYHELGDNGKACELGERALAIRRQYQGTEDGATLGVMNNLAIAYQSAHRYEKAEALYLEAIPVAHRILGDNAGTTRLLHQNLADMYCKMGRYDEAERELSKSYPKGSTKPHVYQVGILVRIYGHRKEYQKVEAILLDAIRSTPKQGGEETAFTLGLKDDLATAYVVEGRYSEAESLFLSVIEGYRRLFDRADSLEARDAMSNLADTYDLWGKPEQAAEWRAKLPATAPATAPTTAPASTAARR